MQYEAESWFTFYESIRPQQTFFLILKKIQNKIHCRHIAEFQYKFLRVLNIFTDKWRLFCGPSPYFFPQPYPSPPNFLSGFAYRFPSLFTEVRFQKTVHVNSKTVNSSAAYISKSDLKVITALTVLKLMLWLNFVEI